MSWLIWTQLRSINERSDPVDSVCRSWRHKQKHDWLGCTLFNWVSWVQLSWVELCCYKHPLTSYTIHTGAPDRGKLVTLIAGSNKRRRLLFAEDGRRSVITRSLNVTPKTTERHLIVRSDISEAEVTNNKRLRSMYCIVEANYWQTRSIARLLCDSKATSFIPLH